MLQCKSHFRPNCSLKDTMCFNSTNYSLRNRSEEICTSAAEHCASFKFHVPLKINLICIKCDCCNHSALVCTQRKDNFSNNAATSVSEVLRCSVCPFQSSQQDQ